MLIYPVSSLPAHVATLSSLPWIQESTRPADTALSRTVPEDLLQNLRQQKTLAEAMQIISRQTQKTVLMEGNPYRLDLRTKRPDGGSIEQVISRLQKTKTATFEETVGALADLYDYSVERRPGVLVLQKRYNDPGDFPEVTVEELKHFYTTVRRLTTASTPSFPRQEGIDLRFRDFATSLTAGQWEAWKPLPVSDRQPEGRLSLKSLPGIGASFPGRSQDNIPGFLPVDLTPDQQQFLRDVALESLIGQHIGNVQRGLTMLSEVNSRATRFYYMEAGPHRVFTNERTVVGTVYKTPMAPVSVVGNNFGSAIVAHQKAQSPDPSDPQPSDYEASGRPRSLTEPSRFSLSLEEWARRASEQESGTRYSVHPALRAKKINLIPVSPGNNRDIAEAIAFLFQLKAERGNATTELRFPNTPRVRNIGEIPAAIEAITPAPFQRAYQGWKETGYSMSLKQMPERMKNPDGTIRKDVVIATKPSVYMNKGRIEMKKQMIRRLRILVDPVIDRDPKKVASWSEVDEEARQLTGFILSMEATPDVFALAPGTTPEYITRFNESRVKGKIYESQGRTWLRIEMVGPSGREGFAQTGLIAREINQ